MQKGVHFAGELGAGFRAGGVADPLGGERGRPFHQLGRRGQYPFAGIHLRLHPSEIAVHLLDAGQFRPRGEQSADLVGCVRRRIYLPSGGNLTLRPIEPLADGADGGQKLFIARFE